MAMVKYARVTFKQLNGHNSICECLRTFVRAATVVGSGSLLVLIIEALHDWFFKRREEYVEQSKNKVEIISKNIPYHIQLSMKAWNLGWDVIKMQGPDYERLMY